LKYKNDYGKKRRKKRPPPAQEEDPTGAAQGHAAGRYAHLPHQPPQLRPLRLLRLQRRVGANIQHTHTPRTTASAGNKSEISTDAAPPATISVYIAMNNEGLLLLSEIEGF